MDKGKMAIILGIVMISITFYIFPIVMDGCVTVLQDANIANYTGLSNVVKITPLLLYVVLLFGGGGLIFGGAGGTSYVRKAYRRSSSRRPSLSRSQY